MCYSEQCLHQPSDLLDEVASLIRIFVVTLTVQVGYAFHLHIRLGISAVVALLCFLSLLSVGYISNLHILSLCLRPNIFGRCMSSISTPNTNRASFPDYGCKSYLELEVQL